MKRLFEKIINHRLYKFAIMWLKKIVLPGFEGLSLYEVLKFMMTTFRKGDIDTKASAISFSVFLAFFPGLIFLLSLIPYVPIENFQQELLAELFGIMPDSLLPLIEETVNDLILKKKSVTLSIGFLLTFYFASDSIHALLTAFNSSFQFTNKRSAIIQRLWSLGLLFTLVFLLFIAIILLIFGEPTIVWILENTSFSGTITYLSLTMFNWLIILLLMFFSISLLYNIGNPERVRWKLVSAGTTLTTLVIILTSMAFAFYLENFSKYNELYGSIGSLIAFLLWIKICSQILLVGFELSAKVQKQFLKKP
ncbi:MAG: YihY/virulence factor BrkB family protein [Bacteroidia bacterium]